MNYDEIIKNNVYEAILTIQELDGSIKEEAIKTLVSRLHKKEAQIFDTFTEENSQKDTIIITNSPASIRFLCKNYPELKNILVTYPSVQQVFGKYIKDEFAKEKGINADCIYTVNVSNNDENAGEVQEFNSVDYTINARELYRIFIRTGAETAYRNPHEPYQLKNIEINHEPLFETSSWKIDSNITETSIIIKGKEEKVAIAHTLGQSRQLLEDIKSGCCKYKVIRLNA